jgi:hypothetical protein
MGRKRVGGGNEERRVRLDDEALRRWHAEGLTAREVAAMVGCSTYPIKAAFSRLRLRRPAKPREGSVSGDRNPAWRGGRHLRVDGYVEVWTPSGRRLEHQVVMERVLGRTLAPGEVVHHKDRDRQNNDPSNLELTTQSAHVREHLHEMHAARYGR